VSKLPSYEYGKRVGYETTGIENFDSGVSISFDFSDLSIKTRQAKAGLSDLAYDLHKALDGSGRSNRQYGFISPKSVSKSEVQGIISRTVPLPSEEEIYKDIGAFAVNLSDLGKNVMKNYANRIKTGKMNDSIFGNTKKSKYRITSNIGWTRLWYKYFGFQENGTGTIRPMRSALRTYMDIMPDVQKDISLYMRNFVSGKRGSR
jgi:hypothetical protein